MEQLTKLRPDRDLQVYFQRPTAVAALSETSPSGFAVSGSWRQQFDWAVVEWNRENVFEHPTLRNLPDGDLSGVRLSYRESRTNCIPMDSNLYPTVEWPFLRIWAEDDQGAERLYDVPLRQHASAVEGGYTSATVDFTLTGSPTGGDYIELAWMDQHVNYRLLGGDSLAGAAAALAQNINQFGDGSATATSDGPRITLKYLAEAGANANRIGVYGTVSGACTETWSPAAATFCEGASPSTWQVDLDFSALVGYIDPDRTTLVPVPTTKVRKMRWTWSASLQPGYFERSEFSAVVTDWTVSGSGLLYQVAGPCSRRIQDDSREVQYAPANQWVEDRGNYSGGSIRWTTAKGASLTCAYTAGANHTLYLGTRKAAGGCDRAVVQVDGQTVLTPNLALAAEDVLVRISLGPLAGNVQHTITLTHDGAPGSCLYFDFLEMALPASALPVYGSLPSTTLATDWDTDHSIAIAPERTAWLIQTLGFHGRCNHYGGALWFYELRNPTMKYSSATITFSGMPEWGAGLKTTLDLGGTIQEHYHLLGDTVESIARCMALLVNNGSTGVWASASGGTLTITARAVGKGGDGMTIRCTPVNSPSNPNPLTAEVSGSLSGGDDGKWLTDLEAAPRINRAARDWSRSFLTALRGYGIEATVAFSMELQHGDDSPEAGIAQRYPNGDAAWLNTPALQTNFSPASTTFWRQVFADMADVMASAGVTPYLQFGETQWWYFNGQNPTTLANEPGLPLYDVYTTSTFQSTYGRPMGLIANRDVLPGGFAEECAFLPGLIGAFTAAIRDYVRQSHADARFEVLYPPDVNDTDLNRLINFPVDDWTPTNLACLKTENFSFTFDRKLDKANESIRLPGQYGFGASQSSHLVGIGEYTTPWQKEQRMALGARLESVVLFALDQFCLIGYGLPLETGMRLARFMGK